MTQLEQNFLEAATRFCRDHHVRNDNSIKEIDWEQRRYEIAKDAMIMIMSDEKLSFQVLYTCILDKDKGSLSNISRTAVMLADILIEELKK